MNPQRRGLLIGSAISAVICVAFAVRWWLTGSEPGWRLSKDGSAWEASRDVNGAMILPERQYLLRGTGTAAADIAWLMQGTHSGEPPRTGAAGQVAAGKWSIAFRAGIDAPRRAIVVVRVMPASAVDAQSLRLELTR